MNLSIIKLSEYYIRVGSRSWNKFIPQIPDVPQLVNLGLQPPKIIQCCKTKYKIFLLKSLHLCKHLPLLQFKQISLFIEINAVF